MQLFTEMSFDMLEVPEDEMFRIERKTLKLPEYYEMNGTGIKDVGGSKKRK